MYPLISPYDRLASSTVPPNKRPPNVVVVRATYVGLRHYALERWYVSREKPISLPT
ncbi:hypothetical protein ACU8KH_06528 [Lachancea thermotolerans]